MVDFQQFLFFTFVSQFKFGNVCFCSGNYVTLQNLMYQE